MYNTTINRLAEGGRLPEGMLGSFSVAAKAIRSPRCRAARSQ
jgi:hypothetical protein